MEPSVSRAQQMKHLGIILEASAGNGKSTQLVDSICYLQQKTCDRPVILLLCDRQPSLSIATSLGVGWAIWNESDECDEYSRDIKQVEIHLTS